MGFRARIKDLFQKPKPVDKTPLIEAIKDYILNGPGSMDELAATLGMSVVEMWVYVEDEWVRSSIRAFAAPEDKVKINKKMHELIFGEDK